MMVTMMMVIALVQGPMMTRRHLYSYTWGLWLKGFVLKAFEDPGFRVPEGLALKFDAYGLRRFWDSVLREQPRGEDLGGNARPITLSTSAKNLNRFRVQG